jgi:hydrogenase maturation protease
MKTLILGLGNPILGDDGIGLRVIEELKKKLDEQEITIEGASLAGLDLLEMLSGYDRVIIIDAIQTRDGTPGQIYRLEPEAFQATCHASTPHDVNFATALKLGQRLGIALPRKIDILAIEVADTSRFTEECTTEVMKAVPACISMIIEELNKGHQTPLVTG